MLDSLAHYPIGAMGVKDLHIFNVTRRERQRNDRLSVPRGDVRGVGIQYRVPRMAHFGNRGFFGPVG